MRKGFRGSLTAALVMGLVAAAYPASPEKVEILIRDVLESERPGPHGDSLWLLLERNVYRLKFHCEATRSRRPDALVALGRGYELLGKRYRERLDSAVFLGNQPRADSLRVSLSALSSHIATLDSLRQSP